MAQPHTGWQIAIECSGTGGSIAFLKRMGSHESLRRVAPILQIVLPEHAGSVCTLAPAIDEGLRCLDLSIDQMDFFSVTTGPGSFTGLRVGVTSTKMLAWACKKSVVPVDTLSAIAQRFANHWIDAAPENATRPVRLVTAINAFRKQVFTARWIIQSDSLRCVQPSCVMDASHWQRDPWGCMADEADVAGIASELWISGGALSVYPLPACNDWKIAPRPIWQPLAEHVGQLGWLGFEGNLQLLPEQLRPNYIRASAAEEKRKL